MLIATGIAALSKKVADERKEKKEARQGHLNIGHSDVAKRAFAAQTSRTIEAGGAGIQRAGTQIKYEHPNDINANSPDTMTPNMYSPNPDLQDARRTSQLAVASPVKSEKGYLGPASPYNETPTSPSGTDDRSLRSSTALQPPPYSSRPQSSVGPLTPSMYSKDRDDNSTTIWDAGSMSSRSTNSRGTHAIRVKTIGPDLKTGFPYHPALFDLKVHPEQWSSFTNQIIQSTKLTVNDHAHVWAAATATAMTGALATSVFVGRSVNRSVQEKKIKTGLQDMSDGGLGDTLQQWNDEYFSKQGLFVHLELSESAMKNADQKSKTFRKPKMMYSKGEERERKKDERKFVIVVTKLDKDRKPTEAVQELPADEVMPAEIGSSGDPSHSLAELPGEEGSALAELPAEGLSPAERKSETPRSYAEMDSDNRFLLEKMQLEQPPETTSTTSEKDLITRPLNVKSESKWSLDKDIT